MIEVLKLGMQRQSITLVFWFKQGDNRKVLGAPYRGAEIKTKITHSPMMIPLPQ